MSDTSSEKAFKALKEAINGAIEFKLDCYVDDDIVIEIIEALKIGGFDLVPNGKDIVNAFYNVAEAVRRDQIPGTVETRTLAYPPSAYEVKLPSGDSIRTKIPSWEEIERMFQSGTFPIVPSDPFSLTLSYRDGTYSLEILELDPQDKSDLQKYYAVVQAVESVLQGVAEVVTRKALSGNQHRELLADKLTKLFKDTPNYRGVDFK